MIADLPAESAGCGLRIFLVHLRYLSGEMSSSLSLLKCLSKDPKNLMVMLTGRLESQSELVKDILDDNGMYFDHYFFNSGGNTLNEKIKYFQ